MTRHETPTTLQVIPASVATVSIVTALALLLVAAPALSAETRILTRDGALASLEADAETAELSLRIADQVVELPGSSGAGAEALHLVDSTHGGLIAAWLSPAEEGYRLHFANWTSEGWGDLHSLEAGDSAHVFPTRPVVSLAEDRLRISIESEEGETESVRLERILFHVVWQETDGRVRFSPIIFQDGFYVGWNEIVTLSSAFAEAHVDLEPAELPSNLQGLLSVRTEADRGVAVVLADDHYGRLGALRIRALPLSMEILGDSVLDGLLNAADLFDPDNPAMVADKIRAEIIHIGARLDFDPDLSDFMSDRISDWIEQNGSEFGWDLAALAEATRFAALDLGRSVYQLTATYADGREVPLLDVGDFLDAGDHRDDLARLIRLSVTADYAAPEAAGSDPNIHLSTDGSGLAISWDDSETGAVSWIQNGGEGWTEEKTLPTSDSLQPSDVRALIRSSIR
ncbi:MAG: hypothetical protein MPN21_26770 [Thermoanaerobaculia bacterium]|nr:hypothetical protein [Thermoanaerobaculia bacterium]